MKSKPFTSTMTGGFLADGFKWGGWTVGYWDDFLGNIMSEQMGKPFDLLLGMKTYALLKNDLVDKFRLKIFPVTLGKGKRLFSEGSIPTGFRFVDSTTSPKGVIVATYTRADEVKTGSFVVEGPSRIEPATAML